jgi:hypothetical protein
MTSYLRKYVTALASAKDYLAQWSSDHVFSDEELIVPFPTLAKFDPNKHVWSVHIKAWVYLPFQVKSLTSYLPSLPNFLTGNKNDEEKINDDKKTIFNEDDQTSESQLTANDKVDKDKKESAAAVSEENHETKKKDEGSDSDDDFYEEALR